MTATESPAPMAVAAELVATCGSDRAMLAAGCVTPPAGTTARRRRPAVPRLARWRRERSAAAPAPGDAALECFRHYAKLWPFWPETETPSRSYETRIRIESDVPGTRAGSTSGGIGKYSPP